MRVLGEDRTRGVLVDHNLYILEVGRPSGACAEGSAGIERKILFAILRYSAPSSTMGSATGRDISRKLHFGQLLR